MPPKTVKQLLGHGATVTVKVNFRSVVVSLPELERLTQQLEQCTQQLAHQRDAKADSESLAAQLTTLETGLKNLKKQPFEKFGELAINRHVISQLQSLDGFSTELVNNAKVTKSSSSRQDVALYHNTGFMRKDKICGAVVVSKDEEFKDDNSEEYTIVGVAGELKLDVETGAKVQLVSNMEKVAGDFAVLAVRRGHIFKEIVMYGVLFDKEGTTSVCKLILNFLTSASTLCWSSDTTSFDECLASLCSVLRPSAQ